MSFSWIPFYRELADKVMQYQDRQGELVAVLRGIKNTDPKPPMIELTDQGKAMEAIDPFSFFASFNRSITDKNRKAILAVIKKKFAIQAEVPEDFDGIPTANNMQSWFCPFGEESQSDDISKLWELARICCSEKPLDIPDKLFAYCREIKSVDTTKLTMGMFWLNPIACLSLDQPMVKHFQAAGIHVDPKKITTVTAYKAVIDQVKDKFHGKSFCDLSSEVWKNAKKTQRNGVNSHKQTGVNYWTIALGKQSTYWDDCLKQGIVRVGWDELNFDLLATCKDQNALHDKYFSVNKKPSKIDFNGIRDFVFGIKPGDKLFVKRGRRTLVGYGEVSSGYIFDGAQSAYRHTRQVKWLKTGDRELPKDAKTLPMKTLTQVTDHDRIQELLKVVEDSESPKTEGRHDLPGLNVIYYGPPGTGKTFTLLTELAGLFVDQVAAQTKKQFIENMVAPLSWWEVITMVMIDLQKGKVTAILQHPLMAEKIAQSANRQPRTGIWAHLQLHTKAECKYVKYTRRTEPLLFSKDANSNWSIDDEAAKEAVPELAEKIAQYRNYVPTATEERRYEFVTFHQSYSYEDFIEGIKPVMGDEVADGEVRYEVKPGIFKELCRRAGRQHDKKFALFIDEINRGNVASIFGELISLIEDDKRMGGEHPMAMKLPYSKEVFSVPSNLYIIGTMNTADRSVEALDTALRRRFAFVAMKPLLDLVPETISEEVELRKLMVAINGRIEALLDADHCIGHSYFMKCDSLDKLRDAFRDRIIPLLKEYFYGNPGKIGMVLGEAFVTRKPQFKPAPGNWDSQEIEPRTVFEITAPDQWTAEAFRKIYA